MDTASLKSFATTARTELIREINARITAVLAQGSSERVEHRRTVAELEQAIIKAGGGEKGRTHVLNKVAYTWFNRIIALRFMDANGYTGIGVVSPAPDQTGQPEVLAAAKRGQVDNIIVSDSNVIKIAGLLNGTRQTRPGFDAQSEAYALLFSEYCRFWNTAMPFMFERESDYTELLIPANLLAEDSVLSDSIDVLTPEICKDVEVIGWLYQFYISERKEEVFTEFKNKRKAGAAEIPAATQLFTPHWIVQYLVENSLGRLWMLNNPGSKIVNHMNYYIPPTDEAAEFHKITTPEELTLIDPACGSGHMLTYAFDLLYLIYEEEGYAPSQIPDLILTHNLYGIEIDPRAGALAAFALTMKASAKRKLFLKRPIHPKIRVLNPVSFSPEELNFLITPEGEIDDEVAFWNLFSQADIFGSLIQPPRDLMKRLIAHIKLLSHKGDLLYIDTLDRAEKVIAQADYLARRYTVVVANPPYMDARNMCASLSEYISASFPDAASGLDIAFLDRSRDLLSANGFMAFLTMDSWMSSFETRTFREGLLDRGCIQMALHLGPGAFDQIGGQVVRVVATILSETSSTNNYIVFLAASDLPKGKKQLVFEDESRKYMRLPNWFAPFPHRSITPYASPDRVHDLYVSGSPLSTYAEAKTGLQSGDNERFVRRWFEVEFSSIRKSAGETHVPWVWYVKSTDAARWFAREDMVINWQHDGEEIRNHPSSTVRNASFYFQDGISFAGRGKELKARYVLPGAISDQQNSMVFVEGMPIEFALGLLNSTAAELLVRASSPSKFNIGAMRQIPIFSTHKSDRKVESAVRRAMEIMQKEWDSKETSPGYKGLFGLTSPDTEIVLKDWIEKQIRDKAEASNEITVIESEINEYFNNYFGLPSVNTEESTSISMINSLELVRDIVSYAVGCMFGRYSLNHPGLILADQASSLQDYLTKVTHPTLIPDTDNVIPIIDGDWFEDDIVIRFRRFLQMAFGGEYLEENWEFVNSTLTTIPGVKSIRDYFIKTTVRGSTSKFYDDHVQRYKKRPIYWLFSSPKGSFNALIYVHRYTPSTVSTVLTYLREYAAKIESALLHSERIGDAKESDRLRRILVELNEYEHNVLFPKASENIEINLDDGVKMNYPKFDGALKKITGLEASNG